MIIQYALRSPKRTLVIKIILFKIKTLADRCNSIRLIETKARFIYMSISMMGEL